MFPTPTNPLPPGFTEADLIDLVDDALAPDRHAALLAARPELAALCANLAADSAALRSLPRPAAPANLLDRVRSALQREALAGLVEAEQAPAPIPISSVRYEGPSVWTRAAESLPLRRLAMAAGFAAAVGVGIWGVRWSVLNWPSTPTRTNAIVRNDAPNPTITPIDEAPFVPSDTNPGSAITLAPAEATVAEAGRAEVILAATVESPAQAMQLAHEGRLAVVVRTGHPAEALRRIAAARADSAREFAWKPLDTGLLASGLASVLDTSIQSLSPAFIGPPMRIDRPVSVAGAFSVALAGEPDLASLNRLLGDVGEVSLRTLDAALPTEAAPPMDAESILWWTTAPSRWVPRATVPIILEAE